FQGRASLHFRQSARDIGTAPTHLNRQADEYSPAECPPEAVRRSTIGRAISNPGLWPRFGGRRISTQPMPIAIPRQRFFCASQGADSLPNNRGQRGAGGFGSAPCCDLLHSGGALCTL